MSRRTRPSLSGGFALAAVTVLVCLLLGEAVSRLSDPEASLWRYPNYIWLATELDDESPLQLRYDSELGYEPRPGVSTSMPSSTGISMTEAMHSRPGLSRRRWRIRSELPLR